MNMGDKAREAWLALPEDDKPLAHCSRCECELFHGDLVWDLEDDGEFLCEDCIGDVIWGKRRTLTDDLV